VAYHGFTQSQTKVVGETKIFSLFLAVIKWPVVIKIIISQRMGTSLPLLASQIFCLQSFVCHDGTRLIAIDCAYIGVVFVFCFVLFLFLFLFLIESSSVSICQQVFLSRKREALPHH